MTRLTITLDEPALRSLRAASERLGRSKSEIVREAIVEFHRRIGRLSESERIRMLRALDEFAAQPTARLGIRRRWIANWPN